LSGAPNVPAAPPREQFPCTGCGAQLAFAPGTESLRCAHCGHEIAIPRSTDTVVEEDLDEALARLEQGAEHTEVRIVECRACGARVTPDPKLVSLSCPYCGNHDVAAARTARLLKPKALLPVKVTQETAGQEFRRWIAGLWFAPNALRRLARSEEALRGLYVPFWTYDCATVSDYTGERGDDYWVTVPVTMRVHGRTVTRMQQVRKTRWRPASGQVSRRFDDVLVLASRSLPRDHAERLEPWDLGSLVPYRDDYLSGFAAEQYQVGLAEGLVRAKEIMDEAIRADVCADIGGDHQRIHSLATSHSELTFKHLLLPVWMSAYRFHDRVFRFLVNARTGEVQGERPWSWVKIALAVLGGGAVVGTMIWLANS
jgi:LSD1 subclass zinc finger protein